MTNKEYLISGLKAGLVHIAFALAYLIFEFFIDGEWWGSLHSSVKLIVLIVFLLVLPAPFTKEFRAEMTRRIDEKNMD